MNYQILTPELSDKIANSDNPGQWLILEEHEEYKGYWHVDCLDYKYIIDFDEIIGSHRVISPSQLPALIELTKQLDYQIVFVNDPVDILANFNYLNEPPDILLNSTLKGNINGLLPDQIQGYNKLKSNDFGYCQWAVGVGKSVLTIALTKHFWKEIDYCFVFVKKHNKINTQRWFKQLGELESIVVEGDRKSRESIYNLLPSADQPVILILNYEKVRDDFVTWDGHKPELTDWANEVFQKRLLIHWDEAPTRMKNRTSKLYKSITKCLYETNPPAVRWDRKRPERLIQYAYSATPIESSVEDYFNVWRVLDGGQTLGTVGEFYDRHVAAVNNYDQIVAWKDIDDIAFRTANYVHRIDRINVPVIEEQRLIDWDEQDRKIYDKLTKELVKKVEEVDENGEPSINLFAALGVMQMLCDAPTMGNNSAALREAYIESDDENAKMEGSQAALTLIDSLGIKLTNDRHTKIKELHDIIDEHPNDKILVYSSFNDSLLPIMESWFDEWNISYVSYRGTAKQKQEAQDIFKSDDSIQVFLSSDAGSDSLNLEEARIGINYDLPWNYSTRTQRLGRNNRRTTTFDTVYWYDLLMADSVELRRIKRIEIKKEYHNAISGLANVEHLSAKMDKNDLMSILKG